MKRRICLLLIIGLISNAYHASAQATLTHRYSFDTDASDLVGSANGVLLGKAYVTNGSVVLDGTNSCVQLPNDLFSNYNSISFEVWYADGAVSNPSNLLYNFSGALGGMNYYLFGQGTHYTGTSFAILSGVGVHSNSVILPNPVVGGINHLLWTQDSVSRTAKIYVNGMLAAQNLNFTNTPAMIGSTTNNLIGAGKTNVATSNFKGNILEFRTYQGALAPLDAAVLDAYGPDQPQTSPGTLQGVRVAIPSPTGPGALFRANVFADFSGITNVNISTQPDLVLTSDNTNVITFAPDQRLQTIALGTANITATLQGISNTEAVTVGVPQDIALVHRYSFNELTNDWIVHDSVAGANGRLLDTPIVAAFTGNGEMKLANSGTASSGNGAYVGLPPGIISSLSEVSVEAWITWTLPATNNTYPWQRIFDFGSFITTQGSAMGNTYLFLTPASQNANPSLRFAVTTNGNTAETSILTWTNTLPLNVTSFVAVTYSPVRGVTKLYLNGMLVSSSIATIPLSGIIDTNNWLGRSHFGTDPYFGGRYSEFRIYSGLLSDSDVAADYAAGPDTVGVDYVLHNYASPNSMTITWGLSATNLILQTSPILGSGAVWNPVSIQPSQGGRYSVVIPFTGDGAFFRLLPP